MDLEEILSMLSGHTYGENTKNKRIITDIKVDVIDLVDEIIEDKHLDITSLDTFEDEARKHMADEIEELETKIAELESKVK